MARTVENMRRALQILGFSGKANVEYISEDRVCVRINGEYFGIWDTEKNTFVD